MRVMHRSPLTAHTDLFDLVEYVPCANSPRSPLRSARARRAVKLVEGRAGLSGRLVLAVSGELRHQPAVTLGQFFGGPPGEAAAVLELDQPVVRALHRLWMVLHDGGDGVGGLCHVPVAEHHEGPRGRPAFELDLRPEHRDQRAFAANQGPCDVNAVLGKRESRS